MASSAYPGGTNIPDDYLNSFTSGETTWNANPDKQVEASKLAQQLRDDFNADKVARAKAARS